jgi:hypothetical protein
MVFAYGNPITDGPCDPCTVTLLKGQTLMLSLSGGRGFSRAEEKDMALSPVL